MESFTLDYESSPGMTSGLLGKVSREERVHLGKKLIISFSLHILEDKRKPFENA